MPKESLPQPWRSFLSETDKIIKEEVAFHCLGGFVVTMLYGFKRSTADVDVVLFVPAPKAKGWSRKPAKTPSFTKTMGFISIL